jgi:hypothetical protein
MKLTYILSMVLALPFLVLRAQTDNQKLSNTIFHKDNLFWTAYNNCDSGSFRQFFTEDVEFYHDKGGPTQGLDKFYDNMKTNLCGNNNFRLKREAIEGTVKVFPLQSSGVVYGAIISGDHVFYVLEPGKKERLDGQAKFNHLWLLKDSVWKMARILSYDHGPAKYINKKKEITLSPNVINQFVGVYQAPQSGTLTVKGNGGLLALTIKNNTIALYPEAHNLFFVKDRDLSFEFVKNEKNKVSRLLVRENGEVVEEAILKN